MVLSGVAKAVPRPTTKHARPQTPHRTGPCRYQVQQAHLTSAACALWSSQHHTNQQLSLAVLPTTAHDSFYPRGVVHQTFPVCVPFLLLSLAVHVGRAI